MVHRLRRTLIGTLLTAYAVFVCVITLTPRMPGTSTVGSLVYQLLAALHARGIAVWADYLTVEFIGNILMFVPLGILTALVLDRRRWWLLAVLGTLFSAFIELSQLLLLPDRYSEVRDIVSNTLGFWLGAAIVVLGRLLFAHRGRTAGAEGAGRSDHSERLGRMEG